MRQVLLEKFGGWTQEKPGWQLLSYMNMRTTGNRFADFEVLATRTVIEAKNYGRWIFPFNRYRLLLVPVRKRYDSICAVLTTCTANTSGHMYCIVP